MGLPMFREPESEDAGGIVEESQTKQENNTRDERREEDTTGTRQQPQTTDDDELARRIGGRLLEALEIAETRFHLNMGGLGADFLESLGRMISSYERYRVRRRHSRIQVDACLSRAFKGLLELSRIDRERLRRHRSHRRRGLSRGHERARSM